MKRPLTLSIFALALLGLSACVHGEASAEPPVQTASASEEEKIDEQRQRLEQAFKAHDEGDYSTAIKKYTPLAEQGSLSAQYNLGVIYLTGSGVPQNYNKAFKWLLLAAEQGDADAQLRVGLLYQEGNGVTRDAKQAFKWFMMAAEQGDAHAQFALGVIYIKGVGAIKDDVAAYMWFSVSAYNGFEPAAEVRDEVKRYIPYVKYDIAEKRVRQCIKKEYKGCLD